MSEMHCFARELYRKERNVVGCKAEINNNQARKNVFVYEIVNDGVTFAWYDCN